MPRTITARMVRHDLGRSCWTWLRSRSAASPRVGGPPAPPPARRRRFLAKCRLLHGRGSPGTTGAVAVELAMVFAVFAGADPRRHRFRRLHERSQAIAAATRIGAEYARDSPTCSRHNRDRPRATPLIGCLAAGDRHGWHRSDDQERFRLWHALTFPVITLGAQRSTGLTCILRRRIRDRLRQQHRPRPRRQSGSCQGQRQPGDHADPFLARISDDGEGADAAPSAMIPATPPFAAAARPDRRRSKWPSPCRRCCC